MKQTFIILFLFFLARSVSFGSNCVQDLQESIERFSQRMDTIGGFTMSFVVSTVDGKGVESSVPYVFSRKMDYRHTKSQNLEIIEAGAESVYIIRDHKVILVKDRSVNSDLSFDSFVHILHSLKGASAPTCLPLDNGGKRFTMVIPPVLRSRYARAVFDFDGTGSLTSMTATVTPRYGGGRVSVSNIRIDSSIAVADPPSSALSSIRDSDGTVKSTYAAYTVHDGRASADPNPPAEVAQTRRRR